MPSEPSGYAIALTTNYPEIVESVLAAVEEGGLDRIACVLTLANQLESITPIADRHGIPVVSLPMPAGSFRLDTACRKSEDYREALGAVVDGFMREHRPDLVMTFGFPIVPPFFFEQASRGAINVHPSDLPAYRGALPLEAMVLDEATDYRMTAHRLTAEVDEGVVFAKSEPFTILPRSSTRVIWRELVNRRFHPFTAELLAALHRGDVIPPTTVTDGAPDAFARKPMKLQNPADGSWVQTNVGTLGRVRIAWTLDDASDIERASRAFDGGMHAALKLFTDYQRRPYLVESVEVRDGTSEAQPGTILEKRDDGSLLCATCDGGTVLLRGGFRPIRSLEDPELELGTVFESTSPIALMTGYALAGLERVVFDA
jgi:methionyl-tRNA formyltransferase